MYQGFSFSHPFWAYQILLHSCSLNAKWLKELGTFLSNAGIYIHHSNGSFIIFHDKGTRSSKLRVWICQMVTAHCSSFPDDGVIKWNHFQRYWPFVRGIHRSPVNSPHKGQWRRALMLSLIVRLVIWDAITPIMTSMWWIIVFCCGLILTDCPTLWELFQCH